MMISGLWLLQMKRTNFPSMTLDDTYTATAVNNVDVKNISKAFLVDSSNFLLLMYAPRSK